MHTRRSVLFELAATAGWAAAGGPVAAEARVLTGVDVLVQQRFARLAGRRVGLITNQTGRDSAGRRTIDLLNAAPGVRLLALFSPEHGLQGDREGRIGSGVDAVTGLPVYSLYGAARRPAPDMLAGLDGLVIDLQDVGVRFFTYATTMGYALEAAAAGGIEVVVLDRPNPIGPAGARGPILNPALRSFTGYFPTPVQHGMTFGELARLFNAENQIGARLQVVEMQGYDRDLWFDQTGLTWINPSPNLRSLEEAILYPGVGLVEGTNVSVGRGTPGPFTLVGAPWIDGQMTSDRMRSQEIAGVSFEPAAFTPDSDLYAAQSCQGVRIAVTDRAALDAPRLGVELACVLRRLYGDHFSVAGMLGNLGSPETLAAIAMGMAPSEIVASWGADLRAFEGLRAKHLIYA